MIGIVLVTHGNLAGEFRKALEHVVGPQDNLETISIEADDDMEIRRADVAKAVRTVDTGAGVIILTDLFGGTPSNMAISMMQDDNIEVIAGINLPMLVKLASLRSNNSILETAEKAQEAGRKYIHVASKVLQGGE
ncbi:MAG: PTS sugar transporter subunit IIA [Rhizobiaceae bacterium]|nr:PTS sugar transporter subunit IIA [Rhizobiaceae bacterium]